MELMEKIVSLCKRRGIIFPGSEIYGGLANSWDFGPLGVELKNNLKKFYWQQAVQKRGDMVGLDAAIIMNPKTWEASGHLVNFTDPLVECKSCHLRYRQDELEGKNCPECKGELNVPKNFNLMFKTFIGPAESTANVAYLRPETAQGMFVNFLNVLNSTRLKIPFGMAQIGKAFRNEITPGNFIFRTREFEQMEIEYFVKPGSDEQAFEMWQEWILNFFLELGINKKNLKWHEHKKEELSHYSKRTVDLQYKFPWGWGELCGLANRTDFDLKNHRKFSGQDLTYRDPETGEKYIPYVIEPSLGVERAILAIILDAYQEVKGGRTTTTEATKEEETVLNFSKIMAPIKVAVLPLSKKEELSKVTKEVYQELQQNFMCQYDESGSIGRRYRRQDEIGTPYCVTIDFDTLTDQAVTVRDRDTMKQDRIKISELTNYLKNKLAL
jgi:glycyl-tRNA synthetase